MRFWSVWDKGYKFVKFDVALIKNKMHALLTV